MVALASRINADGILILGLAAALAAVTPSAAEDTAALTARGRECEGILAESGPFVPEERPYSARDAYRASTCRVILHYGEGLQSAGLIAQILREDDGIEAHALAGGEPGQVELFLDRGSFGFYSQRQLNRGELASDAASFFVRQMTGVDPITGERVAPPAER
jgi:hypothetical protein